MIPAPVAVAAPAIEVIVVAVVLNIGAELVRAVKYTRLVGVHGIGRSAAGDFTIAAMYANIGRIAAFVDGDAIAAGAQNGEGQVGRINFNSFVFVEPLHADIDAAFGHPNLRGAVIEIEKRKSGLASEADSGRTETQFGSTIFVGPEFVAGSDRAIGDGGDPIVGAGGFKGNRATCITQTRGARGRIVTAAVALSNS